MVYGLKEPKKTGVFPGNASVTADEALNAVLWFGNQQSDNQQFDNWFKPLIARIYRYGVTTSLIKELNGLMGPLAARARPVIDPQSRELSWSIKHYDVARRQDKKQEFVKKVATQTTKHIEDVENQKLLGEIEPDFADGLIADAHEYLQDFKNNSADFSQAIWAYVMAYFIDDGVFDYLRRCERPECKRYYIGGSRAKWCSDTCGSIVRVKAKRGRDKEAGSFESRYL